MGAPIHHWCDVHSLTWTKSLSGFDQQTHLPHYTRIRRRRWSKISFQVIILTNLSSENFSDLISKDVFSARMTILNHRRLKCAARSTLCMVHQPVPKGRRTTYAVSTEQHSHHQWSQSCKVCQLRYLIGRGAEVTYHLMSKTSSVPIPRRYFQA